MGAAPPQFGIEGLNVDSYADFRLGRVTEANLTEMRNEQLLIASNLVLLADMMPAKRPGYTFVKQASGLILALFDFQRDYDQKQFLLINSAGKLSACAVDGSGAVTVLSAAEDAEESFQFVPITFACYMTNGIKAYTLLDNAGALKLYAMGISAPTNTPSVALVAGTVTTTYGWQWAYSWVRKVTDSFGATHLHVGPPSPLSASSGPLTAQMANIGNFGAPPDPTWNFIWIWRTNDTPANSTSALFFDAEIAVGTLSYGDANLDTTLDLTRPIPYDNNPPSLGTQGGGIMVEYQGLVVICQGNVVQASGGEVILVGNPPEAFPASMFFQIPGGKSNISGAAIFNQMLYLCTKDYWFTIAGYDVSTFKKQDKILQPGAVGKKAVTVTPTHLVFLGRDKKLYAWDGSSPKPIEVSKSLAKQLLGSLSMEDISSADIENAEVRWYSFGRYSYVLVLVNTGTVPAGQFDWIQLWNTKFLGETLADGTVLTLSETDMFASDILTASAPVEVGLHTYMFLGDPAGNIYRWPDGGLDNGKQFSAALGTPWSAGNVFIGPMFHPLPKPDVVKRYFWADIQTDRNDTVASFKLQAIVADTPDMTKAPIGIPLQPLPGSSGLPSLTAARASMMQTPGCSVGRWNRIFVVFPDDANPATLLRISISAKPLYGVVP